MLGGSCLGNGRNSLKNIRGNRGGGIAVLSFILWKGFDSMQVSRLGLVCLYARLHLENFHEIVNPQPQQHWVTRPDLETIFETKMVSNRSRDHFETKMSHYLEWRDWSRDHFRDQNGLDSGLETSIDTKMSHSGFQALYIGCWKCSLLKNSNRHNSVHLTLLKHQNTKTCYIRYLKPLGWCSLWDFWVHQKILQLTASLGHPVSRIYK